MRHHELDMTKGRIWPVLLMFTMPLLLENTLQLLYYTTDSVIVGQYVGMSALAAVSATTHICGMLVRFFNGTATGAGVVISRAFGLLKFCTHIIVYLEGEIHCVIMNLT